MSAGRERHKTKLINNFFAMGQAALIGEALVAAQRSGVDVEAFFKVVDAGGANSGIFQMIVPSALAGTCDGPHLALDPPARICATTPI